tara:strand:- start:1255 stop:2655 length:1401 start_codon:yes stop_codon:yes gene_type:complete
LFTYRYPNRDEPGKEGRHFTSFCLFCRGWYGQEKPEKNLTPERIATFINPVVAAVQHFPAYLDRITNCIDEKQLHTDPTMLEELGLPEGVVCWSPLLTLKALAYWIDYEELSAGNALNYRWGADDDRELVYYKRLEAAIDGFFEQVEAATTDEQAQAILDEHRELKAIEIEQAVRRDRRFDPDQYSPTYQAFLPSCRPTVETLYAPLLREALKAAPEMAVNFLAVKCLEAQKVLDADPRHTEDFKEAHKILLGAECPDITDDYVKRIRRENQNYIRLQFEAAALAIAAQTTNLAGRIDVSRVHFMHATALDLQALDEETALFDGNPPCERELAVYRSMGRLHFSLPSLLRRAVGHYIGDRLESMGISPLDMQAILSLFDELAYPATKYLDNLPEDASREPSEDLGQWWLESFLGSYGLRCSAQTIGSWSSGQYTQIRVFNHLHELARDKVENVIEWAKAQAQPATY